MTAGQVVASTVLLLAVSGPVLGSATGRLVAQRQGWVPEEGAG